MTDPIVSATYNPSYFDVLSTEQAKSVILTCEGGRTTEQRWQHETPYIVSLIENSLELKPSSLVLDYGCGVGRLAKELIDRHGCWVVGVDISQSMRGLASYYVASPRFMACSPEMFDYLDIKCDCAISVWVLQHCFRPANDIARIKRGLKPAAKLFVINEKKRVVPTKEGFFVNDRIDIKSLLSEQLQHQSEFALNAEKVSDALFERAYCGIYLRN